MSDQDQFEVLTDEGRLGSRHGGPCRLDPPIIRDCVVQSVDLESRSFSATYENEPFVALLTHEEVARIQDLMNGTTDKAAVYKVMRHWLQPLPRDIYWRMKFKRWSVEKLSDELFALSIPGYGRLGVPASSPEEAWEQATQIYLACAELDK